MKICPKCGKETDSKFCPDCGFDLSEMNNSNQTDDSTIHTETEVKESARDPKVTEVAEEACIKDEAQDSLSSENDDKNAHLNEVENSPANETVTDEITVSMPASQDVSNKGKKKGFIIGGIIAAVALIAIIALSSQPKLVSIDAMYNGSTEKGTLINNNSDFTVTGTYDDNSTKDITGWSVDETTIVPGFNNISVTYEDQTANVSVYSPLMAGRQYIASVDEIKDVLYSYNYKYVEGFSGFSKDPEVAGKYNYDGSTLDLSVSFTKKSGAENVDVDGDEIPNAVIVTTMLRSADFGANLDRILSAGAAAYTAVDPDISYDDAYSQIKQCTSDAVDKAVGATTSDVKTLDNLNIGTGMILMNGNLLLFYSFKTD